MQNLIPNESFQQLAKARTEYLFHRLKELKILILGEDLEKVIKRINVQSDETHFQFFLFHHTSKQVYLFDEKISIVNEGNTLEGFSIKQELFLNQ